MLCSIFASRRTETNRRKGYRGLKFESWENRYLLAGDLSTSTPEQIDPAPLGGQAEIQFVEISSENAGTGLGGGPHVKVFDGTNSEPGGSDNDLFLADDENHVFEAGEGTVLRGGAGNDVLLGDRGNGVLDDDSGDESNIAPDGQEARFERDNLGLFTLDIGTTENADGNPGGNDILIGSTGLDG